MLLTDDPALVSRSSTSKASASFIPQSRIQHADVVHMKSVSGCVLAQDTPRTARTSVYRGSAVLQSPRPRIHLSQIDHGVERTWMIDAETALPRLEHLDENGLGFRDIGSAPRTMRRGCSCYPGCPGAPHPARGAAMVRTSTIGRLGRSVPALILVQQAQVAEDGERTGMVGAEHAAYVRPEPYEE